MTILLALCAGAALGYVLERGDMCFHSTWRGLLMTPRRTDLFGAYVLLLVISTPVVQLLKALGWIDPVVPTFAWQANVVGGVVFGIGMVIAATCVTGLFYKLGHGMLGMTVGVLAWMAGDIVTFRGPLSGLRERLTDDVVTAGGDAATVPALFGPFGVVVLFLVAVVAVAYVWRSPCGSRGSLWNWVTLGTVAAAVLSISWLLARAHGEQYTFGTAGVPTVFWDVVRGRDVGSWWIPVALAAILPGSFVAASTAGTLWVRGEQMHRYVQIAVGGFVMGVGAALAGGCNLGHSMVGVPLLSVASIVATTSLVAGIVVGHHAQTALRTDRIDERRPDPAPSEH